MSNKSIIEKVSIPYAEALIELAKNNNLISETEHDLLFISTTLSNSKDLQIFLSNPLINIVVKKNVINKLFQNNINNFILNFLLLLVDRRRISLLITIINKYLKLAYRINAITLLEVFVSVELSQSQKDALVDKIRVMTGSQNIKLSVTIDPNLIGGFIIKIGSKVIDASLAGKLRQISFYLNTNYKY